MAVLAVAGLLCVLAALAYALLRNAAFAALTVAAPVCAAAVFSLMPRAWMATGMLFAGFAAPICVLLILDRVARAICAGAPPRAAVASAIREIAAAVGPVLAAYAVSRFTLPLKAAMWWSPGTGEAVTMAAAFAVSLALGAAAIRLPYSETFIARANAAREWRERLFERPAGISETRWSLSVGGIALVFAAIALFGISGLHVEIGWRAGDAVSTILLAGAFAAVARNWRLTVAATLAAMLLVLLAWWMWARGLPDLFMRFDPWRAVVVELAAMSVFVRRLSRHVNRDEAPAAAIAMALREQGPATAMAFLVLAALALANDALSGQSPLVDAMSLIAGLAAALLFFPAFGNVLYWLLPRYRSVDEVFGKR